MTIRNFYTGVALAAFSLLPLTSWSQTVLRVDARQQPDPLVTGQLHMGMQRSKSGHVIELNNRYLTYDNHPWLPVMGEVHYTRLPPGEWEDELLKMKASGVDIIATYVIWQHHEPRPGQFNFAGDRDLRRFLQLCAMHDMKVVLRLGPWTHGEVRYGGTPDWVVAQMPSRRNDPVYMSYVRRYWEHVYAQAHGLLFKDGGPVIGVQLENEYNLSGPGQGAEHISALKSMAREIGFDVPLYTVTGWDGAIYPKGEVVPVFGGYPDEPWGRTATMSPPNEVYNFRFTSRVAGNAGAQTVATSAGTAIEDMKNTPFLGAEYAGGLPVMYRRRPVVSPSDIAAMIPVQLGSGVNLYGYYMYHGGRNPESGGTLEENALLGAYNDLPVINYDFQAPFGQYGQVHPVLGAIRPFHLFLNSFGDRLAPMPVRRPAIESASKDDLATPRYSVRSLGNHGFVFFNNHVRQYQMPEQSVRFHVDLPSGAIEFPSKPVTVPDGAYFIWPFNFDLDGINLAWATVQPLTRLAEPNGDVTYVFAAQPGLPVEMAFDNVPAAGLRAGSGTISTVNARTLISGIVPGRGRVVTVGGASHRVSIIVLSPEDAADASVVSFMGARRLILTKSTLFADSGLSLRSAGDPDFAFAVFPVLETRPSASLALSVSTSGVFQAFQAHAAPVSIPVSFEKTRDQGEVPPINIGGVAKAALQPYPEVYGRSAAWKISIKPDALKGLGNAYLNISYKGDVARLFSGAAMLDDDFWSGPAWTIGLGRIKPELKAPLILTVLPLRADAPIYLDAAFKKGLPDTPQVAEVTAIDVTPEYALEIKSGAMHRRTSRRRH